MRLEALSASVLNTGRLPPLRPRRWPHVAAAAVRCTWLPPLILAILESWFSCKVQNQWVSMCLTLPCLFPFSFPVFLNLEQSGNASR